MNRSLFNSGRGTIATSTDGCARIQRHRKEGGSMGLSLNPTCTLSYRMCSSVEASSSAFGLTAGDFEGDEFEAC
jgi:hypothetical protein